VYGRHLYALGGNAEASRRSGIKVSEITISAFVLCGLFAAIGGVVITSQLRAAAPQIGGTYLLLTITAVILGGTSLAGGRGTVIGTLVAALILGVLRNGFALMQFSSYAEDVALGAVLIAAVLADSRLGDRLRGQT
jgi:ribose transport system permease protein